MNMAELEAKTLDELRAQARETEISGYSKLKKSDLILQILKHQAEAQGYIFGGTGNNSGWYRLFAICRSITRP